MRLKRQVTSLDDAAVTARERTAVDIRAEQVDDRAATEIFDRYVARLRAMVRDRIAKKLRRRLDADDVVQSTYRSFFTHAEQGDYALTKSGDLWRLLASIALHKLYGQVERHTAARRSVNREAAPDESFSQRASEPEPTPVEVVAIIEQLHLISQLPRISCLRRPSNGQPGRYD